MVLEALVKAVARNGTIVIPRQPKKEKSKRIKRKRAPKMRIKDRREDKVSRVGYGMLDVGRFAIMGSQPCAVQFASAGGRSSCVGPALASLPVAAWWQASNWFTARDSAMVVIA